MMKFGILSPLDYIQEVCNLFKMQFVDTKQCIQTIYSTVEQTQLHF